jgi:hypothetical protein
VLYLFLGPVLLFCGLGLVYLGMRGLPFKRPANSRATFGREDQLMGEVLTEMLLLRNEVAGLKAEVGLIRPAVSPRR